MDSPDSYATGIQSIIVPDGSDIASPMTWPAKDRHPARHHRLHLLLRRLPAMTPWWHHDSGLTAVQALNNGQVDAVVIDNALPRNMWPPTPA